MHTAIVVLNYNGSQLLKHYLPSVIQHAGNAEVWVIDNCSTDNSVDVLKNDFPNVKLVINQQNTGYAGGYNEGLKSICADLYLLINSDIEVTPGWLDPIEQAFINDANLGAAQPIILADQKRTHYEYAGAAGGFIDTYGYPFCRGRIFDNLESEQTAYASDIDCFWASGACIAVRASAFHKLGGFYPEYFAHMEEIDLCWRLQAAGFKIRCIHQSKVYHLGGGTLNYQNSKKVYLNFRNNLIMMGRLLPEKTRKSTIFKRMILDGISAVRFLLTGKWSFFKAILQAHLDYYKHQEKITDFRKNHLTKFEDLAGVYHKSIVADYFLKGKKTFSEVIPQQTQTSHNG